MSQAREIRGKIASIKNTQKITRAMELVAASKMRKSQEQMVRSEPYAEKIRAVISHLAGCQSEYHHPYLTQKPTPQRVGFIVVSTDRGLCGGLNVNLFRHTVQQMAALEQQAIEIDVCLIGRKAAAYFERIGSHVLGAADHLGDSPSAQDLIGVVKVMLDRFDSGELDAIYLASNTFVNTMSQKPTVKQLLPLALDETSDTRSGHWDYIYEPDRADALLSELLVRYIESQVYQAVVDNMACEQAARMVAMKSATDNAGELIKGLQRVYNKARQASITQEIAEIVGGAAAIEE